MSNVYLTSKEDEIGFVKMLIKQTAADGVAAVREIACVRALVKAADIDMANGDKAYKDYLAGDTALPKMSKGAVAYSTLAAIDVSMCDFDFSEAEVNSIVEMAAELGVEKNDKVGQAIRDYVEKHLSVNTEIEKLIDGLGTEDAKDENDINNVFPEISDKKSFVKAMLNVAYIDGEVVSGEEYFIKNVSNSYGIDQATLDEAIKEYEAGDKAFSISTDNGKTAILRCAVRVCGMDSNFDEKEQEACKMLAKELGIEVDESVFGKLAELMKDKKTTAAMKADCIKMWAEA